MAAVYASHGRRARRTTAAWAQLPPLCLAPYPGYHGRMLGAAEGVCSHRGVFQNRVKGNFCELPECVWDFPLQASETRQENRPIGTGSASAFPYDPIGNRTSALGQDGTVNISYTPNNLNQYASIDEGGVVAAPVHDDDGNMLSDGAGSTLSYNGENRLVGFDDGSGTTASYVYDYLGRRVRKTVGANTTTFVYDGWNQVHEELDDGQGTVTTKHNVWGLDLSQSMQGAGGVGGLVAVVDSSGGADVFCFDGNGNVSQVLDSSSGALEAAYEYDAFGNAVASVGQQASANPWHFSTKYVDAESGYSYYGHRYLDRARGRWTRRDPMDEIGGTNLYAFVGNDSPNQIDVLGLYQEAGHYYTVYVVAQAAGWSELQARRLAEYAQLPDEFGPTDAIAVAMDSLAGERRIQAIEAAKKFRNGELEPTRLKSYLQGLDLSPLDMAILVQEFLHAIPFSKWGERSIHRRRECLGRLLRSGSLAIWEAGLVAHALGDSFSHTEQNIFGEEVSFEFPLGHLKVGHADQGREIDNIHLRPALYESYVQKLYTSLQRGGVPTKPELLQGLLREVKNIPAGHAEANAFFGNTFGSHLSYRPERGNSPAPGLTPPPATDLIGLFQKISCHCK